MSFMSMPPMPWARPKGIAATDRTRTAAMAKQYVFFMPVLSFLGVKNQIAPAVRGLRRSSADCARQAADARQWTSTYPAVAYDLSIMYPCVRQQSRIFFSAGFSINCACLLKQFCIADSLCAARVTAEEAKAITSITAISEAFMVSSMLSERVNLRDRSIRKPCGKAGIHCGSRLGSSRKRVHLIDFSFIVEAADRAAHFRLWASLANELPCRCG